MTEILISEGLFLCPEGSGWPKKSMVDADGYRWVGLKAPMVQDRRVNGGVDWEPLEPAIEITPEMVQAGVERLQDLAGCAGPTYVVEEILAAALRARSYTPPTI